MATILVVDDRPSNREYLTTLLGYAGHTLLEAGDGASAMRSVRERRPELVITDILMPNMGGFEFVQQLRQDPELSATKVIFHTATYNAPQAQALADACGVLTLLLKPSEPAVVFDAVEQALGGLERTASDPRAGTARLPPAARDLVDDTLERYLRREWELALPGRLAGSVERLQRILSRLSGLIEVGLEMDRERDPARLVQIFFAAACDIVRSRFAAVAVAGENGQALRQLYTQGVAADLFQDAGHRKLESMLQQHRVLRAARLDAAWSRDVLPPGHPPLANFLGAAIGTAAQGYGWIYFGDKADGGDFTAEDERLAAIMAAKLALLYENLQLYDLVQRHAAGLQIEMARRERAEQEVRASESLKSAILASSLDALVTIDHHGGIVEFNSAAEAMFGLARDQALGKAIAETIIPPRYREAHHRGFAHYLATGEGPVLGKRIEVEAVRSDGTEFPVELAITPSSSGQAPLFTAFVRDITGRKEAEARIKRLNRVYAVLSGIDALIVRVRDRGALFAGACKIAVEAGQFPLAAILWLDPVTQEVSAAAWHGAETEIFSKIRFYAGPEAPARRIPGVEVLHTQRPWVCNDIEAEGHRLLFRAQALEGGWRSVAILPLAVEAMPAGLLVLYAAERGFFDEAEMKLLSELAGDISFAVEHIAKSAKLDYLAYYDGLTGLANRTLFHEHLAQQLSAAAAGASKLAVVIMDVARFKTINDSLGRQRGDELLKEIARRMTRHATNRAWLARVGADHFAIVVPGIQSEEEFARRTEVRMEQFFGQPFDVADTELRVSAKAGIAMFPGDGSDAETLLRNAETALEKAKATGERYLFYRPEMTARVAEKLRLDSKLRRALENEEFELHYQPRVDLEKRQIVGVEALLRWHSPELGLVPPEYFMPLLEETGFIAQVDTWTLRRAVLEHRAWVGQKLRAPRIAVNVSATLLRRHDFVSAVEHAMADGAAPAGIDLEITESVAMQEAVTDIERLKALRALGVNISIDDFGTGHSALGHLARLPVQALKIDRSFIAAMHSDPDAMTLVSTIISLAHSLRLKVVAEGVETEEQARYLRLLRCDEMQGYLISKPLPAGELASLLRGG